MDGRRSLDDATVFLAARNARSRNGPARLSHDSPALLASFAHRAEHRRAMETERGQSFVVSLSALVLIRLYRRTPNGGAQSKPRALRAGPPLPLANRLRAKGRPP